MFPFDIKFSRPVDLKANAINVDQILDIAQEILMDIRTDYFSRKGNRLNFRNRFLTIRWFYEIMKSTVGGYVEVENNFDNKTEIIYEVRLTRIWVESAIVTVFVLILTKEILFSLLICFGLCFMNWLFSVLKHRWFSKVLVKKLKERMENKSQVNKDKSIQSKSDFMSMLINDD